MLRILVLVLPPPKNSFIFVWRGASLQNVRRNFNRKTMTLDQATNELKSYLKYEGESLSLKSDPRKRDTIQKVFIGPTDPKEFGHFFQSFLRNNYSLSTVNLFSDKVLTIYFILETEDTSLVPYIQLNHFLNAYNL